MSEDFIPEVNTDEIREYAAKYQFYQWELVVELCDVIDELRARLDDQ